ncbi:hypothetical protein GCM10010172_51650 [Paractinoplanes ferrugineus]|uniref:Type II restriction enzyme NaeI domain-containing protein n=1 Tax=Paractinoplanes ferrugineus TaxID=113564 RepID=A0A919M9Y4_9ACTN|nr:NaeI family type II restriction endonuclease [Actinoplanes ferrugineus]GIE12016.1 hypothetical protein Afe05nite_38560 [Actinoplanes ferrugineus]
MRKERDDLSRIPNNKRRREHGARILLGPGQICLNDRDEAHVIETGQDDVDLKTVHSWIENRQDFASTIGDALEDTVYYVLDCARTGRYDLGDPDVDSDEKRVIGTKLQYHVLQYLGLPKKKHPDTEIASVDVELKGTIGSNWTIPREGQCGITLAIRLDIEKNTHESWLIRTHRAWLNDGINNDGKRTISAAARIRFGIKLYPEKKMRENPLKRLTPGQAAKVFDSRGQEPRLIDLFTSLPETVIPRPTILTVCAGRNDPINRVRKIRNTMRNNGYELLCGTWIEHRRVAEELDLDLSSAAWAAVPLDKLDESSKATIRRAYSARNFSFEGGSDGLHSELSDQTAREN